MVNEMKTDKLFIQIVKNNSNYYHHEYFDSFIDFKNEKVYWCYTNSLTTNKIRFNSSKKYFEFCDEKKGWLLLDKINSHNGTIFELKNVMTAYEVYKNGDKNEICNSR